MVILYGLLQVRLILLLGLIDLIRSKARVLYQKGQIKTNEYEKELLIMDGRRADNGYRHEQLQ